MENRVEYAIYNKKMEFAEADALEISRNLLSECTYIWQHQAFNVAVTKNAFGTFLSGSTYFGDCIDDEWFIVKLLVDLSIANPEWVISVHDNDGEFLLIEAAEYLPSGVEPETTRNRVFLQGGKLHFIPLEIPVSNLIEAVNLVLSESQTIADGSIQQAALTKALNFTPQFHHASVIVPHLVAHVLFQSPSLIAPAVDAIYTREPNFIRQCSPMKHFLPGRMVTTAVKFSRTLYAQLHSIEIPPLLEFNLPNPNHPSYKSAYLGMKLTVGLELWFKKKSASANVDEYAFADFNTKLEKFGFYRGEIEGSKLYKELRAFARQLYFSTTKSSTSHQDYLFDNLESLMKMDLVDANLVEKEGGEADDWLYLDLEDVDGMLPKPSLNDDISDADSLDDDEKAQLNEMKSLVTGFEGFVDKEGGISGALAPGELSEDESSDEDYQPISFNADLFMNKLSNGLDSKPKEDTSFNDLMESIDQELADSNLRDHIEKDNGDDFNTDINLLKNILDSFSAQEGAAGPASSIISSLGLKLPKPSTN